MTKPPTPPTPLAKKYVRYVLGFLVGVGVALAPYLGLLDIPLFSPLLGLIPVSIRDVALPISAALMGIVAVCVQWYGEDRLTKRWLSRQFRRSVAAAVALLVLLLVVHTYVVVRVPILGGKESVHFVVGLFGRPNKAPCTDEVSDSECIGLLTLNPAAIESFWGDRSVRLARLALLLTYLGAISSLGVLVGLVLLRGLNRPAD